MKIFNIRHRWRGSAQCPISSSPKFFNTFDGVFKPTLLTILGAIMYLRVGWVVGNGGLVGGWLVVLGAVSITLATGLSLSSIATNTHLKAGGPYAMISQSLGLEVGGAVGIPLFLSQAFAVAMYIFGFREGWLKIFPTHLPLLVDLLVFVGIFAIAFISAGLAFRVQYLVMVLVGISLVSIFASGEFWQSTQPIVWVGDFPGSLENGFTGISFWKVFAVFFPAVTGIMSGVNMSGELKNSRQSIPTGTLSAIAVSVVIYLALCWWAARVASPEALVSNYTIMVDRALWGPAVLGGLLAATFSAALSSLVGAPRILMALAQDEVIPKGRWIGKLSANSEPRRALLLSSLIVLVALMLRDLNAIAPLITMFFLITYASLNLVVLLELSLGLINFRPTFKVPKIVPLYGLSSCLIAMFVIDARFNLVASTIVILIYFQLSRKPPSYRRPGDVRSGIFEAIAQWAAKRVMAMDLTNYRAWRPILLVPIQNRSELLGEFRLLLDLCQPEGAIKLLGLISHDSVPDFSQRLKGYSASLRRRQIFTTYSTITTPTDIPGLLLVLQSLQSEFFRPNVLFLKVPEQATDWEYMPIIFAEAQRLEIGVMLFGLHLLAGLGRAEVINLWLTPQLDDLPISEKLQKGSINLAILMSLRLARKWKGVLNLISVVSQKEEVMLAKDYIEELRDLCRIPNKAKTYILVGTLDECITYAPQSDIDLMGLPAEPSYDFVCRMVQLTGSSCLFFRDSGSESALA
ncbi:MAG: amino acid permease [Xenococcaceae cyanobacterium MO_234.B1]|nr:amino acid permease [Xenococcaceae cyanobacterium MO_234.B1]